MTNEALLRELDGKEPFPRMRLKALMPRGVEQKHMAYLQRTGLESYAAERWRKLIAQGKPLE